VALQSSRGESVTPLLLVRSGTEGGARRVFCVGPNAGVSSRRDLQRSRGQPRLDNHQRRERRGFLTVPNESSAETVTAERQLVPATVNGAVANTRATVPVDSRLKATAARAFDRREASATATACALASDARPARPCSSAAHCARDNCPVLAWCPAAPQPRRRTDMRSGAAHRDRRNIAGTGRSMAPSVSTHPCRSLRVVDQYPTDVAARHEGTGLPTAPAHARQRSACDR